MIKCVWDTFSLSFDDKKKKKKEEERERKKSTMIG
jgi:hypothetical protein